MKPAVRRDLLKALAQSHADRTAGRFYEESPIAHVARITRGLVGAPLAGAMQPSQSPMPSEPPDRADQRRSYKSGHGALRRGRVSIPGQIYHVTCTTFGRRRWFQSLPLARLAIRELMRAAPTQTQAYVLMPDHLHWLLQLGDGDDLVRLVNRFKSASARAVNRSQGRRGPVWESGYYDHALRRDEDLRTVARYLVANPVRAGLVGSVANYPHWDAVWL